MEDGGGKHIGDMSEKRKETDRERASQVGDVGGG